MPVGCFFVLYYSAVPAKKCKRERFLPFKKQFLLPISLNFQNSFPIQNHMKTFASISAALLFSALLFSFGPSRQNNDLQASMKRGGNIFAINCANCHMAEGEGIPMAIPPLAKSDYLMQDVKRAIRQVLHGASGEMVVNGVKYNNVMPAQNHLSDQEIADVLNFVMNSWGNKNPKTISPAEVKAERAKK
jgi:nitrite reductase (NO-forming)